MLPWRGSDRLSCVLWSASFWPAVPPAQLQRSTSATIRLRQTGSIQTVTCLGNSFEVVSSTATSTSGLASFPSIYIGANGNIANGAFVTIDSNLPIQVKSIRSVLTDFEWSGGAAGCDFNATYDVWFATNAPPPGSYNDAISGSLMVWLKKPENRHPAGTRSTRWGGVPLCGLGSLQRNPG